MIQVEPTQQSCGAFVTGVNLTKPMNTATVAAIRAAWLDHHVLIFPDQPMSREDLVRFVETVGPIGDDPYIAPMDGHDKIAAVQRRADERGKLFADAWHSDWSFQVRPPSGTCLLGITIPPRGGDTLFSNQHLALERMGEALRAKLEGKTAVHCAAGAYADDGKYADGNYDGAMDIRTSDSAHARQGHPLIRAHPETGRSGLFTGSYAIGFEGVDAEEGRALIGEVRQWQDRAEFVYRHEWQPDMLVMWDNRSVLHQATGGFEGYDRLLHRLTIADDAGYYLPTAATG